MDRSVEDLLLMIDADSRGQCLEFWHDLQEHLPNAAGSTKSHHAWANGYRDHLKEVMNLAVLLHEQLSRQRKLPFTRSSALLVLFLHDCEKPFKHAEESELRPFPWIQQRPQKSDKAFQKLLLHHYGFSLTAEELNGLEYVEGEGSDYVEGRRLQGPLAAFCHVCDTISARIWFDYPEH